MYLRTRSPSVLVSVLSVILLIFGYPVKLVASEPYPALRRQMIDKDIAGKGISDKAVLAAMARIPRERFVGGSVRHRAYGDHPLPIGQGQTISQPYVVALMTEALRLKKGDRVLEIGTGSGYQAAVLAEIVQTVYTIEIRQALAERAAQTLAGLGYKNVWVKNADGYFGWPEHGPFDAIIITASANHIPPPLIDQLKDGGRLILPLGSTVYYQVLTLFTKVQGVLEVRQLGDVAFVPMVGEMRRER